MENPQTQENAQSQQLEIKPTVLDYDDIRKMIPFFNGKEKLCRWCMRRLSMDKVNKLHSDNCHTPGIPFVQGMLKDLDITLKIKNEEILKNLPEGGFITVSNHPFGALDGIMLIKIIGEQRPNFKVMVNMFLNHISAMRPNFIDVDPLASDNPAKRAVSMRGIAEALRHVKEGNPIGFFPAGAVSKFKWTWGVRIQDRAWQPTIMRIIQKLNVPIIPIYFHGHNSAWFTFLGMVDWRLRTLRLPAEVFHTKGKTRRISIGKPIMPEEYAQYTVPEDLATFLKDKTYSMKKW